MRTPGGKKLPDDQWQALLRSERSAEGRVDITNWYHACYCWRVVAMASFMLARESARIARQALFYVQALDQALTVIQLADHKEFFRQLLRLPSIQNAAPANRNPLSHRHANTIHNYAAAAFRFRMSRAQSSASIQTIWTTRRCGKLIQRASLVNTFALTCPKPSMSRLTDAHTGSFHQRLAQYIAGQVTTHPA